MSSYLGTPAPQLGQASSSRDTEGRKGEGGQTQVNPACWIRKERDLNKTAAKNGLPLHILP
jgi:hypothetical protein